MSHKVYMNGEAGPFRCDHCEYYVNPNACNNSHIISLAKNNKFGLTLKGDNAKVDLDGCSDEFEPKRMIK